MKLYYSPGACSQAPHILLHEIGLDHDAVKVDLKAKTLEDGSNYLDINPKGAVPALQLDSGEVLTENAVVLQYIGDRAAWPEVLPPLGSFSRYRVLELVNFITTELHKRFSFLFSRDASDDVKQFVKGDLAKKLSWIDQRLGEGPFLMGEELTLPDAYLFVITRWADKMIGLDQWPNLRAFYERMQKRDSVRNVLRFEGLLQDDTPAREKADH
ncbi:glutathione transferase GstA [Sphingomonas sp.]|uniref:glutathione transferase GstA n=1 Tax=Sphingomonas sp. TaxID=28214 RepID=UPI0025FE32AE|nr:glutathione transferase GstA [Sphingomonas sp.]MBV9529474.1 glutathione transferase GstA [Sphingomonas sp.]